MWFSALKVCRESVTVTLYKWSENRVVKEWWRQCPKLAAELGFQVSWLKIPTRSCFFPYWMLSHSLSNCVFLVKWKQSPYQSKLVLWLQSCVGVTKVLLRLVGPMLPHTDRVISQQEAGSMLGKSCLKKRHRWKKVFLSSIGKMRGNG